MKRFLVAAALLLCPIAAQAQQSQATHVLSAASTNSTSIKPAAGQLVAVVAVNTTAALYYLKFYDTAAAPTCNSSTVVLSMPVPFGASSSGGTIILQLPQGLQFLNGIGMCLTGGLADNDNTNAATGVAINVFFK
jgi:hypothetical protein